MASFTVSSGQSSAGLTVSSGEDGVVLGSGTASAIMVLAGGRIDVLAEGLDRSAVLSGGSEFVSSGGVANGASVGSGGAQLVSAGGSAGFSVVSSGGTQTVWGNASFATLSAGGSQSVSSGGSAVGTTVLSGGVQTVFNGGQANLTVVAAFGGRQYVSAGGVASNTMLSSAAQDFVFSGGTVVSTTMAAGGIDSEVVFAGGVASDTSLGIGNFQYVLSGGAAISSIIGATSIDYVAGSATGVQVRSGGELLVSSGGSANATTVLSGGVEVVLEGAQVSGTRLAAGGAIDVSYLPYSSGGTANLAAGVLTVSQGTDSYTQALAGSYANEYFATTTDGNGGTLITATPGPVGGTPCYCRGTRILTERGDVAVEFLRIGDRLMTQAGMIRPLRWIGRRSYAGAFVAGNHEVLPICIRAGALGDDLPRRDLFVSPLHALYLEQVLVPAAALINGVSIVQVDAVDRVDYFHLELDSHDILLAEGAPAESFVDDDSRAMFHNAAEYRVLYPDAPRLPVRSCAPRVEGGEVLEIIRRGLAGRAVPQSLELQGRLDLVERGRICGWARDALAPGRAIRLRVSDNGVTLGEVVADRDRPDLAGAGYGCHAFELVIPGGLSPSVRHRIDVRCAESAQALPNSPVILEPSTAASAAEPAPGAEDRWRGRVDLVTRERIAGWTQDATRPDTPVVVQILDNGRLIEEVLANRYRLDLAGCGIGHGWHSFDFSVPGGLSAASRHVIEVRLACDGSLLDAPTVLEAAHRFDDGVEQIVAQAVDAAAGSSVQERMLSFMLMQTERLLQQRADQDMRLHGRRGRGRARRGRAAAACPHNETGRRALVVDQRAPDPRRDGGSAAILSHMRALQRLGYSVSFVAAGEMALGANVALPAGITRCRAPFYTSVEDVLRRQAGGFDLVYLHRVDIAARYLALARAYAPRARILYSVADLHHLRLARQAAIEDCPELLAESRRLRLAECTAAWSADAVISHSLAEVTALRQAVPEAQVHHVPWDVPATVKVPPFGERDGVAWVANYAHAPNFDATRFLVEAVMPLVWQVDAKMICHLVGSEMPAAIRRLERPGVVAVGPVDDLQRQVFDRVRLSVAPLRYGAGIKGKVLDSFAAGVPCVMSEIAAEGLPLSPALRAWVAEDAPGLAALICRLHQDEPAHEAASVAGQALVAAHFTAEVVAGSLQAAIDGHGQFQS